MPPRPRDVLRPLRRARQVREFTDEPLTDAELDAITDVGRWTGSSRNTQPWRFVVIRDVDTIRSPRGGRAAPDPFPEDGDGGRRHRPARRRRASRSRTPTTTGEPPSGCSSRPACSDLAAGIAWVRPDVLPAVREILDLPEDRMVRTLMALGHADVRGAPAEIGARRSPAARATRSSSTSDSRRLTGARRGGEAATWAAGSRRTSRRARSRPGTRPRWRSPRATTTSHPTIGRDWTCRRSEHRAGTRSSSWASLPTRTMSSSPRHAHRHVAADEERDAAEHLAAR